MKTGTRFQIAITAKFVLLVAVALVLAGVLAGAPVRAQLDDGDLDSAFHDDGKFVDALSGDAYMRAAVVAPDERVVVAGQRVSTDGTESFYWLALSDDSAAAPCAIVPPGGATTGDVWAASFDNAGRLLLAGSADYPTLGRVVAVMRFLYPVCMLDPAFDDDGYRTIDFAGDAVARAVAITTGGKIVLAGTLAVAGNGDDFLLTRLHASGALDNSFDGNGVLSLDFGQGLTDRAYAVALQDDGRIVVAGESESFDFTDFDIDFGAARFDAAGQLDPTFFEDGIVTVPFDLGSTSADRHDAANALAIDRETGTILLAGYAERDDGRVAALVRFTAAGELDNSFSGDGFLTLPVFNNLPYTQATALAIQDDGKILVGASTHSGIFDDDWVVMRRDTDGGADVTFGALGERFIAFDLGGANLDFVGAVALHAGKAVAAGVVQNALGFKAGVARLWSSLIFADGFEAGDAFDWEVTQPEIP